MAKDKIAKTNFDFFTLLNQEEPTGTATSVTLYNGRKFSDYPLLLFMYTRGAYFRATQIIPKNTFAAGTYGVSMSDVDSVNTQRWCEVKYIDDTHVTLQCSSNAVGTNTKVYLYGISTT